MSFVVIFENTTEWDFINLDQLQIKCVLQIRNLFQKYGFLLSSLTCSVVDEMEKF